MAQGAVRFKAGNGYGFIAPDGGGADLFVRFPAGQSVGYRSWADNRRVEFEVGRSQKGPRTERVRPL